MKTIHKLILLLPLVFLFSQELTAQNFLRVNAGYLMPSGEYADKSVKEESGMAREGMGYSMAIYRVYDSGMGWSFTTGRHTNPMAVKNVKKMAKEEFGGEWDVSADQWRYYFAMPGFVYRVSWVIDAEVGVSAGYVYSVSPELRADYNIQGTSGQETLDESQSFAIALKPALRVAYPLNRWSLYVRWSAFLARPQFNVTLLDGEEYDVRRNIINQNIGIGVGYRF